MAKTTPVLKLILCGEYGVGKSSIFRRYIDNSFVDETGPRSTIGLDSFSKSFDVDGKIVKLELWDTAGIERFATMSSSYYQSANAAILCYSLNDRHSFNMLSQHILEIVMHSKTAKIFLCGNKSDMSADPEEQVTDEDLKNFELQCDNVLSAMYKISCRHNDGVCAMFTDIASILQREASNKYDPDIIQPSNIGEQTEYQKSGCCKGS